MNRRDQDVLEQGRKNALENVEVPLRERSLQKLVKKLEGMEEGRRTVEIWDQANVDRAGHLKRQQALLQEFDEFIEPIYEKTQDWMSDLHLPITFTVCKTYHARFLAALLGSDPSFNVKARQAAYEERVPVIQDVMRYTLNSWVNNHKGVDEVVDQWLWRWVTAGTGILKQRWDRKFTRYIDVVERQVQKGSVDQIGPDGQNVTVPQMETQEVEEEVTDTVFDGPCLEDVPEEDIVIVGGKGDPQEADDVIQQMYLTASDLWTYADQGIFREDAVTEIIKAGEDTLSGEQVNAIKIDQDASHGNSSLDKGYDLQRYQILERYTRLDVDGSGINTEVIMWVHKQTGEILRATYLRRVMKAGLRPYSKITFHQRNTKEYPVGIPELLYSVTKEMDALENIKLDINLQTSLPMGFYRPTSSMNAEILSYGPGELLPLDSPQADIYFPNFGNRTTGSAQEQMYLMNHIERLMSISDLSFGVIGGQGASRTATGTRALQQESNSNLDIFLRRLNRGWKSAIVYLYHQLQEKLPPGFEMRVLGDDGKSYFRRVNSKEEICGSFDFELEANSANSNPQVKLEQANTIYQMTGNMLDVQLGIISPIQRYESMKNLLQAQGVRDFGRFLQKPSAPPRIFSPLEIANRVLNGIDVPLGPEQDLPGFLAWFEHVLETDELLGQFSEEHTVMLFKKYQEAQTMLSAIKQQQAQFANQQQVAINAATTTQTAPSQGPAAAPSAINQ